MAQRTRIVLSFSSDGRALGFWMGGGPSRGGLGLLKVTFPPGGPTARLWDAPSNFTIPYGASWGSDGTIVFAQAAAGLWRGGLWRISATGGNAELLTTVDASRSEFSHQLPFVLPGSRAVLFTITYTAYPQWNATDIAVQSLRTGERKILIKGGADARYVPTGHLLYMRTGTLMAVPFSLDNLEVTGAPVALTADVMQGASARPYVNFGMGQFSVSDSGVFVYLPGGLSSPPERSMVWVDRTGAERPVPGAPRTYSSPRLSPDGQRFAFNTPIAGDTNVWVSDILRGSVTRLANEGPSEAPLWAPDGQRIAFTSVQGDRTDIVLKAVDGGSVERLTTRASPVFVLSWTPDGSALAFAHATPETLSDIWVLPLTGDRQPVPLLTSRFNEAEAEFSPDGRWLAYVSDESGRQEVFVRPYPGPGGGQAISTGGGNSPAWSRDGRQLFFTTLPAPEVTLKMMAVLVTAGPTFTAGTPRALFEGRYNSNPAVRQYDVSRDGSQFLMIRPLDRPAVKPTHMILVQNWFEELKRLVPAK